MCWSLSVNSVWGNNRCLFWQPHKTHKYTEQVKRRIAECHVRWYNNPHKIPWHHQDISCLRVSYNVDSTLLGNVQRHEGHRKYRDKNRFGPLIATLAARKSLKVIARTFGSAVRHVFVICHQAVARSSQICRNNWTAWGWHNSRVSDCINIICSYA